MKASQYKKIRRLHQKAQAFHETNIHRFWTNAILRRASVHARDFHKAKAHQNHLKWYAAFTEGWKFGADADQIRKDHNYPEFNPKTAGSDEPYEEVYNFDKLVFGQRLIRLHQDAIDDGIN